MTKELFEENVLFKFKMHRNSDLYWYCQCDKEQKPSVFIIWVEHFTHNKVPKEHLNIKITSIFKKTYLTLLQWILDKYITVQRIVMSSNF